MVFSSCFQLYNVGKISVLFCICLVQFSSGISFVSLYKTHEQHITEKWSESLYVYEREFLFLRNQRAAFSLQNKIRVLEMGIASVGFLQILAAYFGPEQAEIVGFGIEPTVCLKKLTQILRPFVCPMQQKF